jgi:DNA gyrase subunit A
MEVVEPDGYLLLLTQLGYGKRHSLAEYPVKSRATSGILTADQKSSAKTGEIASVRVVQESDDVTIISSGGLVLRLKVKDIGVSGRGTRGFRLMNLGSGDTVASVARFSEADLKKSGDGENSGV